MQRTLIAFLLAAVPVVAAAAIWRPSAPDGHPARRCGAQAVGAPGPGDGRRRRFRPHFRALRSRNLMSSKRHPDLDGRRFSLSFAQPTPIRDILLLLVSDTNLSLIPDPALEQTFIGELKNVTLREALDLILEPLGLDYSVRGNVIRVFVRELETRLYSIDYVITRRTGSRSMSASTGASGGGAAGAAGGGAAGGVGVGLGGGAAPAVAVVAARAVRPTSPATTRRTSSATFRQASRTCCHPTASSTWIAPRRCCR